MTARTGPRATAEQELVGEVVGRIFANPATGFGVVELLAAGTEEGARATGPLAALVPGQSVRLVGAWTDSARYGPTFAAIFYEQTAPRSTAGLTAFLSSERFKGVGPALAERLVAAFGLQLAAVLESTPGRLSEVRGVSPQLASSIAGAWQAAGALAALVERLAAVGVPPVVANACHRQLGDQAGSALDADPYALLAVRGARWVHAEALARAAGVHRLDPRRMSAGALAAHRETCNGGGHVALNTAVLLGATQHLLGATPKEAREALDLADQRGALISEQLDEECWYRPEDLAAERQLAADIARLAEAEPLGDAADLDGFDEELTREQRAAVDAVLTRGVSVLTGGPGTGKTRAVLEIVRACEARELRVALCAPTGRAARRLEEVTGRAAGTIHRLLEARGVPGQGFRFGYDRSRRLPADVVVVDEASMADLGLAGALVQAVPDRAHLLLVGDADQLPSVGPGAFLRDLLDPAATDLIAATRLTTIHRQAAQSRIVTLAHEVNAGSVAPASASVPTRDRDVFTVPVASAAVADRVAAIVAERAPAYFACGPAEVQVLAPMYRGPAGVDALNAACKALLNPAAGRPAVSGLHEGDRVVQTRNDADLDVANGDVGEVSATDRVAGTVEVAFPQGAVIYDADAARDLAPAWCLTVHKSQGGEWPVVVLVLDPGHRSLLARELVYTAVTRASRGLLLVGAPELLAAAARRPGGGAGRRRTGLAQRLAENVQPSRTDVDGDHGP